MDMELRILVHYGDGVEAGLFGNFVAETEAIVEHAEHQVILLDRGVLLGEFHAQLVVMVADFRFLPPNSLPGLVESGMTEILDFGFPADSTVGEVHRHV